MSATIIERARAFEMIAAHLPVERRQEVAEALASKIMGEIGEKPKPPAASAPEPAPLFSDLSEHTEIAVFLADHGFERRALVDATVALAKWLAVNEGRYTRAAGMRVWLAQQKESA